MIVINKVVKLYQGVDYNLSKTITHCIASVIVLKEKEVETIRTKL